jgi:hypothetical protein
VARRLAVLEPGDAKGVGKTLRFTSRGWLPYILRWTARMTDKEYPRRIVLSSSGDHEGEGRWTFEARGPVVDVEYVWTVEANKPLVRYLSFILRPMFGANHLWAMDRGQESLRLELAQRRAASPEERARIPGPPRSTFLSAARRRRLGLAGAG